MQKYIGLMFFIVLMVFTFGCAPTMLIKPPDTSVNFNVDVKFAAPQPSKDVQFVAKNGVKSKTEDNVTVEVDKITSEIPEGYSVTIKDPDATKGPYEYKLFPMMLVLTIANKTDHIVTLERTIVRLEDEKGNEFPMIISIKDQKESLSKKITGAYRTVISNVQQEGMDQYKHILDTEYKVRYQKMLDEIKDAQTKGADIRTPDVQEGQFLTPFGIESLKDEYSPEKVYQANYGTVATQLGKITQNAVAFSNEATQKIEEIPDNLKGVITNGVYQPINILPGRTDKIIVPFKQRKEGEKIKQVLVGVYDLPTRVNEAGVPTKRANFNFEMIAAE